MDRETRQQLLEGEIVSLDVIRHMVFSTHRLAFELNPLLSPGELRGRIGAMRSGMEGILTHIDRLKKDIKVEKEESFHADLAWDELNPMEVAGMLGQLENRAKNGSYHPASRDTLIQDIMGVRLFVMRQAKRFTNKVRLFARNARGVDLQ